MVMFTYVYVLHFYGQVWYGPKHGLVHNQTLYSQQWNFLLSRKHTALNIFTLHRPMCVVLVSSCLADGACLPCLVVWGWGMLPTSSIRLLTNVSLNCWCDNFEPNSKNDKAVVSWYNLCPTLSNLTVQSGYSCRSSCQWRTCTSSAFAYINSTYSP
jgi:hypothetical protein